MPLLNGLEVLKRIMKEFPRPVIMLSSLTQEGAEVTIEALSVGAFDYLPKSEPGRALDPQRLKRDLIEKSKPRRIALQRATSIPQRTCPRVPSVKCLLWT